jgi:hypothetical protein
MSDKNPHDTTGIPDDPTADIAETQAPVHIEERGLDEAIERALVEEEDHGRDER